MYEGLVRLVATLLILQKISLSMGGHFSIVFSPNIGIKQEDTISLPEFWEAVKKAVQFASGMDKKYPKLYSRLEMGRSWTEALQKLGKYICK